MHGIRPSDSYRTLLGGGSLLKSSEGDLPTFLGIRTHPREAAHSVSLPFLRGLVATESN